MLKVNNGIMKKVFVAKRTTGRGQGVQKDKSCDAAS
jgi:hypothetical protein